MLLRLFQFGSGSSQLMQSRRQPSLQFVELPQALRLHIAQSHRPAKTSEKNLRHHAHLENVPISQGAPGWSGRGRSIAARRRAEHQSLSLPLDGQGKNQTSLILAMGAPPSKLMAN